MKVSPAYLTGLIEEVPPEAWKDLFETVGWPSSLKDAPTPLTHERILTALKDDELSAELHEALEAMETLGTESGRQAIETALADQHLFPDTLPANEGDRVYALRLFVGQRSDAALAEVLARAEIQVQQTSGHRAVNEFVGKEARRVASAKKKAKQLEQATREYCQERSLGDYVLVRAIEDDDVCIFRIVRSHHTKRPLAVVTGRAAHATIEYQPAHVDLLRYDMVRGQLQVIASAGSVVEFYRRTLGLVLFEDPSFFDGEPLYSLQVLQERGRTALADHSVPGVGQVWMTECLWEHTDRDRLHLRSTDCFGKIDQIGIPRTEGAFVLAKLKMQAAGKSTRPVTITVRAPSRVEVRPKWQEPLALRYLAAIGVRNPALALRRDLWSVSPGRQEASVWLDVFGSATDGLVHSGALVPVRLASVPHPEHPGAGRVLDAHELPDGAFYGVSQAEEIPSRSLSGTDLGGLELHPEALRLHLRSLLGISSGGIEWNGDGLLHLGVIDLGGPRLHVTYALRPLTPGVGARLRDVAKAAHAVVLIPTARCDDSELAKVMLDAPLPSRDNVIRDAVAVCGLRDDVSPLYSAPDGARLIVDTVRGQIWLDGVVVPDLDPGTQAFRFVELLARSPSFRTASAIAENLSAGRKDGDQVVRSAKTAATKAMQDAMQAANKPFENPFQMTRGAHRCAFLCYVIDAAAVSQDNEGARGAPQDVKSA